MVSPTTVNVSLQVSFRHPTDVDRFVPSDVLPRCADSPGDSCCYGGIVFHSDRYVQDDESVDLVHLQHRLDGLCMLLFCRKADHIDRISERRGGREKGGECGLCLLGQFRQAEPFCGTTVGAEHSRPARIGQDADVATGGKPLIREPCRQCQEFL